MIVIIGASASGKTEISRVLQNEFNYIKCITTTTRQARKGERDNIDYHFLTKEDFLKKLSKDEFVEHTSYNDNYYGINKKDIKENSLVIVDPNGANELIRKLSNKAFIVYVETDKEIRKNRMIKRGDNTEIIKLRLKNDTEVFNKDKLLKIDLVINNKDQPLKELAEKIDLEYKKYKDKI